MAFVADPLSGFHPENETTSFLMAEICKRGGQVFHCEIKNLSLENDSVTAKVTPVKVTRKRGSFVITTSPQKNLALKSCDYVWLRKDPPFDLNYLDHLSILEFLQGQTQLINDPTGIKLTPEKIFPLSFKGTSPETLISQDSERIAKFVAKHKKIVLKPLNLSGGKGIVIAGAKDPDLNSLIEIVTKRSTEFVAVQKFVPAASKGDKRVLIWNGEVLGCFLRVPGSKDFRGNLHSGAKLQKAELTKKDQKILSEMIPLLQDLGLLFVGVDFLGSVITEVNVTSPMGIGEINTLFKTQIEKQIIDDLEQAIF